MNIKEFSNYARLSVDTKLKIKRGVRVTKSEMAYEIGKLHPFSAASLYWDTLSRQDIVSEFNKVFNTNVN